MFSISQAIIYLMYAAAFKYGAKLVEIGEMHPSDIYRYVVVSSCGPNDWFSHCTTVLSV